MFRQQIKIFVIFIFAAFGLADSEPRNEPHRTGSLAVLQRLADKNARQSYLYLTDCQMNAATIMAAPNPPRHRARADGAANALQARYPRGGRSSSKRNGASSYLRNGRHSYPVPESAAKRVSKY